MAQTGYTPIYLYYSSTATNQPSAGNLGYGELAINITDGKLFYKDNANAVQVIGWKTTPTTAGGTGLTSYTAGDLTYYASGTTLSKLAIGAANTVATSTGSAPQWSTSLTLAADSSFNGVSIGKGAGSQTQNTVVGNGALAAASTSNKNTTIGYQAGKAITTGNGGNTIVGNQAGQAQTTSVYNTIVGHTAGYSATGSQNTFVGYQAGYNCSGTSNTFIGPQNDSSGYGPGYFVTGNYNTIIGAYAGNTAPISSTGSNYVVLSDGVGNIPAYGDASQNWVLPTGNLVIGTSGKGIDFSATAGTGTSELLADYEEGTWTPSFNRGSTQPTVSYSTQTGSYTKIGRQVTAVFDIVASSISGGSGDAIIGGLPFVKGSFPSMSIVYRAADAIPAGAAGTQLGAYNNSGDAILYLQYENSGTAGYGTAGTVSGWNGSGRINGWVVYFV